MYFGDVGLSMISCVVENHTSSQGLLKEVSCGSTLKKNTMS